MYESEIYVLCESRSAELANQFLNACLSDRRPIADDYPFPEYSDDPLETFQTVDDLLVRLEQKLEESYSIYWESENNGSPRQAMLFFTQDGAMIAGVGGPRKPLSKSLEYVARLVNGQFGYVTSGSCPPESQDEFIQLCRDSSLISLVEGNLQIPSS